MNEKFLEVGDVMQILGISRSAAYKLMRQINSELEKKGYIVIRGKVSRKYFEERIYGMSDGKRRYKFDRKDHKVSVKLSEKDMDILKVALNRTGMTASAYLRELIRTGGNIDTSYPEDRAKAIRIIAGIANNINQTVKLGN